MRQSLNTIHTLGSASYEQAHIPLLFGKDIENTCRKGIIGFSSKDGITLPLQGLKCSNSLLTKTKPPNMLYTVMKAYL